MGKCISRLTKRTTEDVFEPRPQSPQSPQSPQIDPPTIGPSTTAKPEAATVLGIGDSTEDSNTGDDGSEEHITGGDKSRLHRRIPRDISWGTTIRFVPPVVQGRVIKVYDGDTITVAGVLPYSASPVYRFSVRLTGIDTPEMRTEDENEHHVALKAKQALSRLILHKWVTLEDTNNDKYGRLLADVYCGDVHVNEWMIEKRFAVRYDGGTKHAPDDWVIFHRTGGLRSGKTENTIMKLDK